MIDVSCNRTSVNVRNEHICCTKSCYYTEGVFIKRSQMFKNIKMERSTSKFVSGNNNRDHCDGYTDELGKL